MKRTKKKNPEKVHAILTADWHLREDTPVCRTDDFIAAQWDKVRQVRELQKEYGCPVYHAGDLFDHWKPSPALLSKCLQELPSSFYTVYGNHDLPQHSMELEYKSGVRTLIEAGKVRLLEEGHWDYPPEKGIVVPYFDENEELTGRLIAVWHTMVWTSKTPFPGAEEKDEGHRILKQYPQFDLIVTGDNHQSFVCKQGGRLLVNTGNLTRQTAGQKDFEPCVWLYDAEQNEVRAHYLDINEEAVSRLHIEKKEERDERIQAFVERLDTEWEGSLDFLKNLQRFAKENNINEKVMQIAYKALEQ